MDQRQQVFDEAQAKLSATLREGGALEAEIAERTSALQAQRGKVNALTIAPPWLDVQEKRLLNRAKHEDPEAAQLAELTVAAARGDKGAAVKVWAIRPLLPNCYLSAKMFDLSLSSKCSCKQLTCRCGNINWRW